MNNVFSIPSLRDLGYMAIELMCCLFIAFLWGLYQHHEGVVYQKAQNKETLTATIIRSDNITSPIVAKYVPAIQYIQGATITIKEKVPVYVTKVNDSKCIVNNGFVSLWNSTNKMLLPASSGSTDAGPSPVVLSDIAAQHASEVNICSATEKQRDSLKEWILGQQQAFRSK